MWLHLAIACPVILLLRFILPTLVMASGLPLLPQVWRVYLLTKSSGS